MNAENCDQKVVVNQLLESNNRLHARFRRSESQSREKERHIENLKWMLQGKADEIRSLQSSPACRASQSRLPVIDPTPEDEEIDTNSDNDVGNDSSLGLITLRPDEQCVALLSARIPAVPSNTFPPDHPDHEAQCIDVIRKADKHIAGLHLRRIIHNNNLITTNASSSRSLLPAANEQASLPARTAAPTHSCSYLIVVVLMALQMSWAFRIIDIEISGVDFTSSWV